MIIKGSEAPTLVLFDSSHKFLLYQMEKLETFVYTLAIREITIPPNYTSLDMDISNTRDLVVKDPIPFVTMSTSHPIRTTCPTQLHSRSTVLGVWVHRVPMKIQQVLRKGKHWIFRRIQII